MMPHVIVHTPEPRSAAARYVWELVTALAAEGVQISLVYPKNLHFGTELEINPQITLCPTRERSTDHKRGFLKRVYDNALFLVSSLAGLLRAGRRGDVVHFQFVLHFPFGALFFLVARLRGYKIVFTVHDPVPHRWLLPPRLHWLEQGALALAYQVSDRLIVHSEPGKAKVVDYFQQDPRKISVIAHGPFELGGGIGPMVKSDRLEVLLFGSIRENKGIDLAIEAVQALYAESADIRLTIAGGVQNQKEQAYWERCMLLIKRNPEPIRVLAEFIPDDQLPALFARSHCVLLPYTEFFSDSGVAQMALSNGRPIIATRSGGLGPLLLQGELGLTIEDISSEGIAEVLRSAIAMGVGELERLGQNGAETVNQRGQAWRLVAQKTLGLYLQTSAIQPETRGRSVIEQGATRAINGRK